MKKIEFIWRHLLFEAVENHHPTFRQQDLARQFDMSSSTVNAALRPLRELAAVKIGGRGGHVTTAEKILYHWANHRRLNPQISTRVNLPVLEIEGLLPPDTIPTAYTAVRERWGEPPADYDKVYCYHPRPQAVLDRFTSVITPGPANLFVLPTDRFISNPLPLSQIFVDLWQLPDWYAKDFIKTVKTEIDGLLS